MTLRPEYSLGHSAYNDFLFGSLGAGEGGTEITVLSALSRLGIDPWQEAERLAALPRETAAQALADTIARLPAGAFAASPEAGGTIASRLVALLPAGVVAAVPQTEEARVASLAAARPGRAGKAAPAAKPSVEANAPAAKTGLTFWLMWAGLGLAFYFLILALTPGNSFDSYERVSPPPVSSTP
jgi:hypothetical protein